MTLKCFKNKNSYLFTQKSMVNFSIFLITTLLVTILIGQPSTAIISNSNQSAIIISQNSNQVNSTSSNSSADSCVESPEKEEKKIQNRHNNPETIIGPDSDTRSSSKRGGKNTFKIVSPKTEETNNKPTISWCAVEGATSYEIYIGTKADAKIWKIWHEKKDPQSKYPNLLHLPYPNDEPHLKSEVSYKVTIQPKKNEEENGSEAWIPFTFSESQNN